MFIFLFCLGDVRHFEPALEIEGRILALDRSVPVLSWRRVELEFLPHGGKNKAMYQGFARLEFDGERECGCVICGG